MKCMRAIGVIGSTALFLLLGTSLAGAQPDQQDKTTKQDQQGKPDKRHQKGNQDGGQQQKPNDQQRRQQPNDQQQQQQQPRQERGRQRQQQGQEQPQPPVQDRRSPRGTPERYQGRQQPPQRDQYRRPPSRVQPQPRMRTEQRVQPQPRMRTEQRTVRPYFQARPQQRAELRVAWQRHRARSWQSEHRTWRQRGGYGGYRVPTVRFRRYFGRSHRFRIYNLPVAVRGGYPRFECEGYWFSLVDPWPEYWPDDWYERDTVYIESYEDGYYLEDLNRPGIRIGINISLD